MWGGGVSMPEHIGLHEISANPLIEFGKSTCYQVTIRRSSRERWIKKTWGFPPQITQERRRRRHRRRRGRGGRGREGKRGRMEEQSPLLLLWLGHTICFARWNVSRSDKRLAKDLSVWAPQLAPLPSPWEEHASASLQFQGAWGTCGAEPPPTLQSQLTLWHIATSSQVDRATQLSAEDFIWYTSA